VKTFLWRIQKLPRNLKIRLTLGLYIWNLFIFLLNRLKNYLLFVYRYLHMGNVVIILALYLSNSHKKKTVFGSLALIPSLTLLIF